MRDQAILENGIYVEIVEDEALASGFGWGPSGPVSKTLQDAIGGCRRAALIEVAQRMDACVSHVAALGRALRDLGGVAVRMEASGLVSAWKPWLDQLERGGPAGLCAVGVSIVQGDETYFTCGMHQFDLPDAEVSMAAPSAAAEWLRCISVFQVAEQPVLATGHTFRPDEQSTRRVIERWPDHRHRPDDGRHNPFGVWRILPEGVQGLAPLDPVPVIMPSLAAQLTAAEQSKGRALTRGEVEHLVEKCPAIAMQLSDTLVIERSRGYADIEPRRAWEQWQIVRAWG